MPTGGERFCVDTSVAVAALDTGHAEHTTCRKAAQRRRPVLSGHAAFETYSVLTRLPGRARVPSAVAWSAIAAAFPERCWLSASQHERLLQRLASEGIEGGMVYDALVGEAASEAGLLLLTRDLRALRVYDLLGVRYDVIE